MRVVSDVHVGVHMSVVLDTQFNRYGAFPSVSPYSCVVTAAACPLGLPGNVLY